METQSKINFANEKVRQAYLDLETGTSEEKQLKEWLDNTFRKLVENAFSGIQIQKRLIPKEYGPLNNLWKYNLPKGWRIVYTIYKEEAIIVSVILEWFNHKEYEKRFNY